MRFGDLLRNRVHRAGQHTIRNTQAHAAGVRAAMKLSIGLRRLAEKNMRIEDPESCFRSSAHSFSDGSPSLQGLLSTKQACHQARLVREQREGGQCRTGHTIGR